MVKEIIRQARRSVKQKITKQYFVDVPLLRTTKITKRINKQIPPK